MRRNEKCALLEQDMTLRGYFEATCADQECKAAIWLDGEEECSYTFGDMRRRAYACAEQVAAARFGEAGGWAGIAVETCPEWPLLLWGLIMAGRQPVLLDPSLDDKLIEHLLKQSGATALITRRERKLSGAIAQASPESLLSPDEPTPGFRPAWADLVALCTSGTTATSRVFVYDGCSICKQILGFVRAHEKHPVVHEKSGPLRTLCFLPLNHVLGLMTNVMSVPFLGYPQVYLKDRAPQTILETCRRTGVNMIIAVPLLVNNLSVTIKKRLAKESVGKRAVFSAMSLLSLSLQRLWPMAGLKAARKLFHGVNQNLFGDSLRLIVIGGSHAPGEHLKTINSLGYAVVLGFGMTEAAITSVELSMRLKNRLTGSVGRPLPITDYKVRPDGKDLNRGELLIRTSAMHVAQLIDGALAPAALNEEGWYETGDVVRLGRSGRMYVEGRTKDIIIGESGENVYPDELEDTFAGLEGVEQLCVLGTKADTKGNPYDVTTLVLSVGARYGDEKFLLGLAQKVQQLSRGLSQVKRIQLVLATPEALPVVNSIKVKRVALREMIEQHKIATRVLTAHGAAREQPPQRIETLPEPAHTPEDLQMEEIREKVRLSFAEMLEMPLESIGDDAHFIDDLGGDSLQSLGVSLKVEEIFGIVIPTEEYTKCTSVNDLSGVIYAQMHGHGPFKAEVDRGEDEDITPVTRFEDTPEFSAFVKRLKVMEGQKNPYFVCHESPLMATSLMEGRQVLNFGSYNYVGMSGRKETMEAAKAAIDKYGTSASGSRLLAGEKSLYQELEREIARWKHAEAALVLVGGHSTNVTIVGNFCGKDDLIVYDAISHNSVQEGCRLSGATSKPFPHNDVEALESILRAHRHKFVKVLIIVEGAYSMDGDIAPIPAIVALKKKYGCFLMVDEAHSACVIGRTGGGVDEYFDLKHDDIDIKMGTLSKGLGTCGGYLAGSRNLVEYLRYNLPGFVFSVGISPPLAAATLAAIRALEENPRIIENLHRNIQAFLSEARRLNLNTCLAAETAIVPVLVGRDEDAFMLSTALSERGVFVPPAVYPAVPKNKARLRFCVISEHTPEQIRQALDILVKTAVELGIALPPASTRQVL
ncbi:MAG: aminotransferase class I/II-fold pyridoxal phosphate-dependent enzyme [Firmicutes bacterium]|nr:aminotransferase class I/II-fold pyridoxal phosphate-dependent enzyme [Bacillota bacterium]